MTTSRALSSFFSFWVASIRVFLSVSWFGNESFFVYRPDAQMPRKNPAGKGFAAPPEEIQAFSIPGYSFKTW
jgi:hypothetical protein